MADNNETGSAVSEDTRIVEADAEPVPPTGGADLNHTNGTSSDTAGTIGSELGASAIEDGTTAALDEKDKASDAYHAKVVAKAGTLNGLLSGLVKELRPKQWVKNVLVLAAPFFAGGLTHASILLYAALAFAVFSMAASGVYFVNDAIDVEADRAHPTKRNRPIAAGLIPLPIAYAVAVVLLGGSLAISAAVNMTFFGVIAVYVGVQLGYCFGLKHQPVIDLCIVASGFLLRALAGGAAAGLYISPWFALVTGFGSMFMVAGKRYAEVKLATETGAKIRKSLKAYSPSYLRFVWAISAAISIMSYSLWAYQIRENVQSRWGIISIVPFFVAILRYAVDVDRGTAGEPEEVVLKDKALAVVGLVLAGCLAMAFYHPF